MIQQEMNRDVPLPARLQEITQQLRVAEAVHHYGQVLKTHRGSRTISFQLRWHQSATHTHHQTHQFGLGEELPDQIFYASWSTVRLEKHLDTGIIGQRIHQFHIWRGLKNKKGIIFSQTNPRSRQIMASVKHFLYLLCPSAPGRTLCRLSALQSRMTDSRQMGHQAHLDHRDQRDYIHWKNARHLLPVMKLTKTLLLKPAHHHSKHQLNIWKTNWIMVSFVFPVSSNVN